MSDVEYLLKNDANTSRPLRGNASYGGGDFRSAECLELMKQSDIVITNPPFSLFREFLAQLVHLDKKFLIVGSQNAISYAEVFKLIEGNRLWLGNKSGDMAISGPRSLRSAGDTLLGGRRRAKNGGVWVMLVGSPTSTWPSATKRCLCSKSTAPRPTQRTSITKLLRSAR